MKSQTWHYSKLSLFNNWWNYWKNYLPLRSWEMGGVCWGCCSLNIKTFFFTDGANYRWDRKFRELGVRFLTNCFWAKACWGWEVRWRDFVAEQLWVDQLRRLLTRIVDVVKTVWDNVTSIGVGLNFGKFSWVFVKTVNLKRFFSVKKYSQFYIHSQGCIQSRSGV